MGQTSMTTLEFYTKGKGDVPRDFNVWNGKNTNQMHFWTYLKKLKGPLGHQMRMWNGGFKFECSHVILTTIVRCVFNLQH